MKIQLCFQGLDRTWLTVDAEMVNGYPNWLDLQYHMAHQEDISLLDLLFISILLIWYSSILILEAPDEETKPEQANIISC